MDRKKWLFFILFILCAVFVYKNNKWSAVEPVSAWVSVEDARMAVKTVQGDMYIVDKSCNRILKVDPEGKLCALIPGGSEKAAFCYAVSIQPAKDGGFYLLDYIKSEDKSSYTGERIRKFDPDGKQSAVVYEKHFQRPEWNCITKIILNKDGVIHSVQSDGTGLTLMNLENMEDSVHYDYKDADRLIRDYTIEPLSGTLYYLTKTGEIGYFDPADGQSRVIYKSCRKTEKRILSALSFAGDGQLYVTDTWRKEICSLKDGRLQKSFTVNDYFYDARVFNGFTVCGVEGIYEVKEDKMFCHDKFPLTGELLFQKICFFAALLYAGIFLAVMSGLTIRFIRKKGTAVMRGGAMFLAGISVFIVVFSMITMKNVNERFLQEMLLRAQTAAEITAESIPRDAFLALDGPESFMSQDYERVREAVERGFLNSYGENSDLYCVLYSMDGMAVLERYRLDESCGAASVCPWEGEEEAEIIENKRPRSYDRVSTSEGTFIFVLVPLMDENGNGCGIIEVGKNIEAFDEENRKLVGELFINIIALAAVIFMIVMELLTYLQAKRAYFSEEGKDRQIPVSVWRMIVFMIFFLTNISTGFLPILANEITEELGQDLIPPSVLAAVPISAEVLTGAVFSVCGSSVTMRLGRRRAGRLGAALFLAGLFIRFLYQNLWVLTIGSAILGCGWGILLLTVNISIASEKEGTVREEGFTGYSTAAQNGVNAGVVFGGFLLYWLDYQKVFLVGALLGILVLRFVRLYFWDGDEGGIRRAAGKLPVWKFLFSPRIMLYFIGIVFPVVAAGYYLNYLYPVLGSKLGLSETNIGYSYLINAFCIMGCSNVLTRRLTKLFPKKWIIVMSAGLYAAAFLLAGFLEQIPVLLFTLGLLGVADSFGGPVQSAYFAGLPEVERFGYDRAVGILGLAENLSETLGPFLFGIVLAAGVRQGLFIMAGVIIFLALVFGVTGFVQKRRR